MIKVLIEPRKGDGLYEIHVGDAGDKFLVSHQGYENASDAEDLVRRIFAAPPRNTGGVVLPEGVGYVPEPPEPVDLTVRFRDGKGRHDMIR